jgi:hypothetical protein
VLLQVVLAANGKSLFALSSPIPTPSDRNGDPHKKHQQLGDEQTADRSEGHVEHGALHDVRG